MVIQKIKTQFQRIIRLLCPISDEIVLLPFNGLHKKVRIKTHFGKTKGIFREHNFALEQERLGIQFRNPPLYL